jgi:hypothetical protein
VNQGGFLVSLCRCRLHRRPAPDHLKGSETILTAVIELVSLLLLLVIIHN